ncbi:hypothetical protein HT585_16650 [Ensifer sp. HO-A22]|jgi:hypothetical protein|uniref:Uncharacterized protein n=1 Tax=Ensifer oleiphilus TaxID=2742698 RepID=A0A7Y6UNP8_9HYPH|nr:hypothetical protein [Ensifer oleiphilus]NVD40500.1 hypothetical protein [Ensifer oleiphilus]
MRKPKLNPTVHAITVPGYKPVALPAVRAAHLMLKSKHDADVRHAQRKTALRIVNQFDRDTD